MTQPHAQGQIGPYRIQRELGRGAMGAVYLAKHQALGREVAVKVLLDGELDAELLARFRLEASVASKLQHPGIVSVHDVGQHKGRPYLVMDYCPGQSLDALLKGKGKQSPRAAARLIAQIARAVGYAHRQGVLHRDLKPANVILVDGAPRVTDFGLAQDRSLQRSLTRTGDVLGTPCYMAPEQIEGRKDVDPRVDVYSLGVMLYLCLTGQRPYEAPSVYSLMQVVCAGGCVSPSALAEVPRKLERICMRALALDREERPADGDALANALEDYLASADVADRSATRGRSSASRAVGLPAAPLARGVWGAIGATLILAVLGLGWVGWELASDPPTLGATPEGPEAPVTEPPPPPPPPPPPAASEEAVAALERSILELFNGGSVQVSLGRLAREVEPLQSRFPDDPRLEILVGFSRLPRGEADALDEKRRWLSALNRSPVPSDVLAALTARLCYELGFHRAASDALRARAERESLPADWAVHTTVENHLLTSPPVRDDALAERLTRRLLARRERSPLGPGELDLPDRGTILAYRAVARAAQGEVEQAARELEAAEPGAARLAGLLRRAPRMDAQDYVSVSLGVCELLAQLPGAERKEPRRQAAARLAALGAQLQDRGRPDHAALAWVRGARAAQRRLDASGARELLERARQLDLSDAPDVRCLVARVLGRAVLERDPQRAERLGLEAVAAWEEPEGRTPGELADAWLLVARARRQLGDEAGAQLALAAAQVSDPIDTRELEALRRER